MFPELCPSCGAVLDAKRTGRSMTCGFCGRVVNAIDEESRSSDTVEDVKKLISLGDTAKAYEMVVGITDRDSDNLEAWILRGNLATKQKDRELAFSATDRMMDSIPSGCAMIEFVWNTMVFNWRCSLEIDGESIDLGPGMRYRTILKKGDHDLVFRCNTNGISVSDTISLDSFSKYRLDAKLGLFSKTLTIDEMEP